MKSYAAMVADEFALDGIEKFASEVLKELECDRELHAKKSMAGVAEGIDIAKKTIEAMLERAREELK